MNTAMNPMITVTGSTYKTSNYELFTRLEGNRPVLSNRVTKIKGSITKNGYIFNPIVVNEKMEIIDGQGRFEALKMLGRPIDYVIAEGAGLQECIALNASGTIWTITDYINSYCEMGNENYIRLRDIMNEFPEMGTPPKIMIITGMASVPNDVIKAGRLNLPEELAKAATKDLEFARRFAGILKRAKGDTRHYFYGLVFASHCGADKSRLEDVMEVADLQPAPRLRIALDFISDNYNKNLKIDGGRRIYLYALYEETMSNKYGWYGAKWGGKTE